MNFLLARVGQLESRRAVQNIWKSKRGNWVCAECETGRKSTRARTLSQQRRDHSDDALRWPGQHGLQDETGGSKSAWGLSWEDTGRSRQDVNTEHAVAGEHHPSGASNETARKTTRMGMGFFDSPKPGVASRHVQTAQDSQADIESQVDLWERFEGESGQTPDARPQQAEIDDEAPEPTIPVDSLLDLDYKTELRPALGRKASDLVIRCLFAAAQAHDMDFIGSIPAPMFTQILQLLEPSQFVAKLGTAHIELSTALAASINIAPMREVAFEYNKTLLRILKNRRMTGHLPTLEDYTLLLRSARLLGSHKMASIVWRSLLKDGLQPSTQCFNSYMASLVWNGVHSAGSRHKVRVIPFFMMARSATHRDRRFMNYRIGDGGVKEDTMKAFGEMLAFGAVADHESFQILITACARDGDMNTVKAILQRVWGINVEAIMDGKDETTIAPKSFSDHSSIRPRPSLLFALAHAFGINNDVPSALRVVDFVARHYQLDITPETWSQLFEWTFVLASQRQPTSSETGKLPKASVLSLWNTMTGSPYFIKPTLGMYSRLISNLVDRRWTSKIFEVMHEALPLHLADEDTATNARRKLTAAIRRREVHTYIEAARHEWEYAHMIRTRNVFWLRRWIRQVLTSLNIRNVFDGHKAKCLLELPQVLWEWRRYVPRRVRYEIASGFVELEFHEERDVRRRTEDYKAHAQEREALIEKSGRYVGNDWTMEHKMSERNLEERAERERRRAAVLEEKKSRSLVGGQLTNEYGGIL